MRHDRLIFITHPEVVVDPKREVTDWSLSETGRARVARFAASALLVNVTRVWSSAERKAQETADILSAYHGLTVRIEPDLGENDRSATGFLPPQDFEAAADAFFAAPDQSHLGWETARDAQTRITSAVRRICADHVDGDLALVSHGAVGTLLLCALSGLPIDRAHDQPHQGHYWAAPLSTLTPEHGWRALS
ncbi:histidine phosphatase family protein [Marivita geojedonensis]|uniref:Phosphoglycerate mutase n=1 Tax=Marivita geojedonensis TaxID=1123756 RepID=A0A1X4NHZ8_9RHOB|nr:histidine phosphatase family protein [Marivita geojedonensis]OSQ47576.1 phosphoglycerate mutase [Marivita geojedonensis]PRY74565.1 broad specificity phosphatase PhoE [Marivita geojedonensis]